MSNWNPHANELFLQAIEITNAEELAEFLQKNCGDDADLLSEVHSLLNSHRNAGKLLEQPAVESVTTELVSEIEAASRPASGDTLPDLETQTLAFLAPSENPDALGRLGQYEILEVIGRGGMGIVLRGVDPKLNRVVAIKVLSPDFAVNPTAHKRFLREAQAAAAVSHDHIVTIYAVEEQPIPHLAMEFIDGKSLQQKIDEEGQLEIKEVLRIARQIAAGLAAAHEQGLTHRDIKPSNILLQNGIQRVQITDFGLARVTADADITRTGEIAGTPQYMSPEQAKSEPVDPRSDLFSLGSVMYAMCCGHSPFRAETPYGSIKRVCEDEPRSIRENNPEIPTWLEQIIFKLLEKNPDDRFQSAEEVVELLGKHLSHLQDPGATAFPGLLPAVKKTSPPRPSSTRRHAVATVAVVLLALLTLGFTEAVGVTHMTSTVIRLTMGEGTLVIEVDDPSVEVSIDGEELSITGAGLQELKLRPGQYQFQATKDGKPLKTELVSISRNGRQVVHVAHETRTSRSEELTKNEWIDRAFELAEEGKWGEASAAWDRSLKAPSQGERHPYAYALYPIVMNLKAEDYPRAETLLSQNYEACYQDGTNPNWARITLFLGQLSPRPSIPDQTFLDWYRKNMIEKEPQEFAEGCSLSYGLLLYRQGKYEEALKYLPTNSLPTLQELSVSILFRSMAYAQLGKLDEARSSYREAEQVQTLNVPARDSLDDIGKRSKPLWYAWAIYDIAHEQARDLLTERGIDLSDLNPPPAAGVSLTPFVVLGGNNQEVTRFSSLEQAVLGSTAGDTIEIRGNGPFVVTENVVVPHSIRICAAEGHAPVFRADKSLELGRTNPLITLWAPAVLEGIQVECLHAQDWEVMRFLIQARSTLKISNCRIISSARAVGLVAQSDCDVVNCDLRVSPDAGLEFPFFQPGQTFRVNNSVLGGIRVGTTADSRVSVNLDSNTFCSEWTNISIMPIGPGGPKPALVSLENVGTLTIFSKNNLFYGQESFVRLHDSNVQNLTVGDASEWVESKLQWRDEGSLIDRTAAPIVEIFHHSTYERPVVFQELDDWQVSGTTDQRKLDRGVVKFKGGVVFTSLRGGSILPLEGFRLRPDSAGYQSGPDGKDLGADIDFVGPGEAYERWKQTEDYQQWLQDARQLLQPESPQTASADTSSGSKTTAD